MSLPGRHRAEPARQVKYRKASYRDEAAEAPAPALLAGKPIVAVQYRAVGKFVGPPVFNVNRLAPVPGILAYDRGAVIDARTGARVPDNC